MTLGKNPAVRMLRCNYPFVTTQNTRSLQYIQTCRASQTTQMLAPVYVDLGISLLFGEVARPIIIHKVLLRSGMSIAQHGGIPSEPDRIRIPQLKPPLFPRDQVSKGWGKTERACSFNGPSHAKKGTWCSARVVGNLGYDPLTSPGSGVSLVWCNKNQVANTLLARGQTSKYQPPTRKTYLFVEQDPSTDVKHA